jgi:uncharacterized protein
MYPVRALDTRSLLKDAENHMIEAHVLLIARELTVGPAQVRATAVLFDEGATVPFIARYRKEATGGLDEVQIITVRDRLEQLGELDRRKEAILGSMKEQGVLTEALSASVKAASTLSVLEDLYLPYRPKRRTRGSMARDKGLKPLAKTLFAQGPEDPAAHAAAFVTEDVETADNALAGARDIIAEWINEDADARAELRTLFKTKACLRSKLVKGREEDGAKFRDYFDWEESAAKAPSHRILAMLRGASEGMLRLHILPEEALALPLLTRRFVHGTTEASAQVAMAVEDAYKRLLAPALETELRRSTRARADEGAIAVFAANLRELLLASPLGRRCVLGLDPGLRTGCKIVCLDAQGRLLDHGVIYPLMPMRQSEKAAAMLKKLVSRYTIEAIAVGNGTGGREAMDFASSIDFGREVIVVSVNEAGASVYSASQTAREEFPDHDLTVRGAVSIGRRLMDPLAELVKIDPKSIGVGQYQHDVDQKALKTSLDDVVVSCVNAVGVEVNTASRELLRYVSGLSPRLASNLVALRDKAGPFLSRKALLKVSGLGPKAFEQAAGFLRIRDGKNPLDDSAVHPERYRIVEAMASDLGCAVADIIKDAALRDRLDLARYVGDDVGMPTLVDIQEALGKAGRDLRERFEPMRFTDGVVELKDVKAGMRLPGVVTNVTGFGAFVDVGVHQDGLVHISQLADRFVKDPLDVVKVGQRVMVTVLEVDLDRRRIGLSMRKRVRSEE